jgi:hypothetical protein
MNAKQTSNPQNRIGLWLYFENALHEQVSAYLRSWQPPPYWGRIQGVRVSPSVVSRIIPRELQEGVESWLVLYRASLPQELLVLPFPESDKASILNSPNTFGNHLSALLEYVHGGNPNWYPYNGFRNLIGYINREKTYPFSHPSPPLRFQVVRHYKPIEELLKKPEFRHYDEEQRETVTVFTKASQNIQRNRDELLTSLLTVENAEQIRELLENFETTLLEESGRLSHLIDKEIPSIIKAFESVMDDETKTFLISAETVARFARKHLSDDFDFSLCGCGLWKAVERELNSSLIWNLRLAKGIAGKDRKPIVGRSRAGVNYEAGSQTVNIDKRERGSTEFEGITLGNIKYLLRSAHDNNIAEELKPVLESEPELLRFALEPSEGGLAHLIGQVTNIRNGHAHIKAMKEKSYQDLRSLVIEPDDKPTESLLGKILEMKRHVADYWNSR